MAQKLSTRKRPDREDKRTKPERRLEEDVFDRASLFAISKLKWKGYFDTVDYCIAKGKEANVYRATTKEGKFVALKIYRLHASSFVHMQNYIEGDRRFQSSGHSSFGIIFTWTRKEFSNLKLLEEMGVKVPKPIAFMRNILVMDFVGENGVPFSPLSEIGSENPKKDKKTILGSIEKMWKNGFVHADASEYNILMSDDGPVFIDCGQGVLASHPRAEEFYARDKKNIETFFSRYEKKETAV